MTNSIFDKGETGTGLNPHPTDPRKRNPADGHVPNRTDLFRNGKPLKTQTPPRHSRDVIPPLGVNDVRNGGNGKS